jgi:osmotically inducible protein OsmC
MTRKASAHWKGSLKTGSGALTTGSKTLAETPYSFAARFEEGQGTNPEELLAAAHAGCFTMALSNTLGQAGFEAEYLETSCVITLDVKTLSISSSELTLKAKVPGASREQFEQAAMAAKEGCPVSKLYRTEIRLDWTLE